MLALDGSRSEDAIAWGDLAACYLSKKGHPLMHPRLSIKGNSKGIDTALHIASAHVSLALTRRGDLFPVPGPSGRRDPRSRDYHQHEMAEYASHFTMYDRCCPTRMHGHTQQELERGNEHRYREVVEVFRATP